MVCNNVNKMLRHHTETVWHLDVGALIDMEASLFRQGCISRHGCTTPHIAVPYLMHIGL
jgi:hypothetical protein